jgi:putative acetyltransferase
MGQSSQVTIRAERSGEERAVRAVVERAFGDAVVGELVDALRASWGWTDGLSFVAERDGELVGHVLFTRSWLDAPTRLVEILVLSPLSVVPEHQRGGIGGRLVREGLAGLGEHPEPLVVLEGSPAYYRRFGFRPAGALGLRRPSTRIPADAFQAIALPAHEPWMTGTVVYAEPFWALDCVGLRPQMIDSE